MILTAKASDFFTKTLLQWHYQDNKRTLPWKSYSSPYIIWLSEIILQQTRIEQGIPYFERFVKAYPDIQALANAADEDVFRLWQGLGYYNRCRNLLTTARFINNELKGQFPTTYNEVLQLKGVGDYTAAAIVSFAYGLPYAVVDGNVYRVLSRYWGIETPIDTTIGKKQFQKLAQALLDMHDAGTYNQAIMDFGATVCKPAQPHCTSCVFQKNCAAFKTKTVHLLPVKAKKLKRVSRFFHYVILIKNNKVWICLRQQEDIWEHLYEPYLIETKTQEAPEKMISNVSSILKAPVSYEGSSVQKLSHQTIHAQFYLVKSNQLETSELENGNWIAFEELKKYAFPKTIVSFFQKKNYF